MCVRVGSLRFFYSAHCLPFTATTTTSATSTTPTTATGKVGLGDDASGHTARNAEEDESGSGIRNRGGTANDGTDRGRVRAAMRRGEKIQKTTQRESKSAFWFLDGTINEWSGTVTCSTHSNRRHSTATYSEYFLTFFFWLPVPESTPTLPLYSAPNFSFCSHLYLPARRPIRHSFVAFHFGSRCVKQWRFLRL